MASPADRQREAQADVERITDALWAALDLLGSFSKPELRGVVVGLLHRDVIRVGHRPAVETPMTGQTVFDPFALEDDCDADD